MSVSDTVYIIDFGSQYTELICKKVRACEVYCEIKSPDFLKTFEIETASGIILSGGPGSINLDDISAVKNIISDEWNSKNIPILGICMGCQLIVAACNGSIESNKLNSEYGISSMKIEDSAMDYEIFSPHNMNMFIPTVENFERIYNKKIAKNVSVWMSHKDSIVERENGWVSDSLMVLAYSEGGSPSVIKFDGKSIYGFMFHPEVSHTNYGKTMIEKFLRDVCCISTTWKTCNGLEETVSIIKDRVGESYVIMAVSGGVDSTVCAKMIHNAIGDKLLCVMVDNGLMREGEVRAVKDYLSKVGIDISVVDASVRFISSLKGISSSEEKRKVIGKCFIDEFVKWTKDHEKSDKIKFLGQGTIYPDVIESGKASSRSVTIKSHHNVGGLPDDLGFNLIEPLKNMFKNEVRSLGISLGLPTDLIYRHPFPGPGLAIRIPGEVTEEKLSILRKADFIFIQNLKNSGLYTNVWQAGAVLLPVHSVGVMGDSRSYGMAICLRAVMSIDGMTARPATLPLDFLEDVGTQIMNKVDGINRVLYDVSCKPPSTIEWE